MFLDMLNSAFANSIKRGDQSHGPSKGKSAFNVRYLRWLELGPLSSFLSHVFVVFGNRAKKQMVWVDATRSIAAMENVFTGRYWSEAIFPYHPMSINGRTFSIIDFAVSLWDSSSSPKPASVPVGAIYFWPKTLEQRTMDMSAMFGHV